jgi:hypothetical protein
VDGRCADRARGASPSGRTGLRPDRGDVGGLGAGGAARRRSSALLALWLTFKNAFAEGALLGANLFAVGWFTRRMAPVYALRIAASRGNREALRMLEILDPLWAKIRQANEDPAS